MAEITIKEYAERHGLNHSSLRHRCERGGYKTARKLGRDWVIDEDEVFVDRRVKGGNYKGARVHAESLSGIAAEKERV